MPLNPLRNMIIRLDPTNIDISKKIHSVFQASYAIEAELLKATNFPPLKRSIADFLSSQTAFYGIWNSSDLIAVIEVLNADHTTHIQSLVVDPNHFRKGLAQQLISYVFSNYNSEIFTVETGVDNKPAISLYEKFNFISIKEWDTDHGVRKVKFENKKNENH